MKTVEKTSFEGLTSLAKRDWKIEAAVSSIDFYNDSPSTVVVRIGIENPGDRRSAETVAHIGAAEFGAFLPAVPLGSVRVPALAPGQTWVAERRVDASRLPADRFVSRARRCNHWIGNIDIFIGDRVVDRHQARGLELLPGVANLAFFKVGSGRDAYMFEFEGSGVEWNPRLSCQNKLEPQREPEVIIPGAWQASRGTIWSTLEITPPPDAIDGSLDIVVRQKSSGRMARVEIAFVR